MVGYAPIVYAKPSDMSTVYTVMKKCTEMLHALGQSFLVQTMDQQLYCIAKQVMWNLLDELDIDVRSTNPFTTGGNVTQSTGP